MNRTPSVGPQLVPRTLINVQLVYKPTTVTVLLKLLQTMNSPNTRRNTCTHTVVLGHPYNLNSQHSRHIDGHDSTCISDFSATY